MRFVARCSFAIVMLCGSLPAFAQRKAPMPPALPALSAEGLAAYDELAPRFAAEVEQIQGWYRGVPVMYFNFGDAAMPVAAGRVLWPIHGFDARGNPVAMRGQRPIFSALPGLPGYSGLFTLTYVVTADHVQPNQLRDVASVNALVRRKGAALRETNLTLNLPIVARGSRLARDTTSSMLGWYEGRDIQFYDFGVASVAASPMWRFARGNDAAGMPDVVMEQNSLVDSVPVGASAPDLWEIRFVRVDSAFVPNSLKSAAALRDASVVIDPPSSIRNLPITLIDGKPVLRAPSPIRAFADVRSPFPPAPTPPQE